MVVYSGSNTDCKSSEPLKTLVMLCYVPPHLSITPDVLLQYGPSQWKRPPGRPRNSWLSVASKDMKGVGTSDAMVMVEDRMRWKRVVAEHARPQEDMLPE